MMDRRRQAVEWNEPLFKEASGENSRIGVLVMHGFTGSPRSLQELAERLVAAGYTVALPLLAGHGLTPEAMEKVRWTDWTADAERAYAWLKERTDKIFVIGLSMGGTLALWMAEHHAELSGVITVNALLRHPQEGLMRIVGRVGLPRWLKAVGNDIKFPGVDEKAYDKLLASVRGELSSIGCPALVFSSVTDHVVPPQNQREIYDSIASSDKELIPLHHGYHVATMDYDKEIIFAGALEFIAGHAK
jgi:carboxylesterase